MAANPSALGPDPAAGQGAERESERDPEKALDPDLTLQRERSQQQAVAEGHDADIPSDTGYVLDERGEQKRRQSIADQRLAHRRSLNGAAADVEKEAGFGRDGDRDGDGDGDGEPSSSDDEANVIWWDGPDDPENPYNWPTWRKVVNCVLISALTFITPLASCKTARPVADPVPRGK